MRKILVCGGRQFCDMALMDYHLSQHVDSDSIVINGDAQGADCMAAYWAKMHGIHHADVPALWNHFSRQAGSIRNHVMLQLEPDLVIAFPGGYGTGHMVGIAKDAKFEVIEIK